jgi:hypothetical protein
MLQAYALAKAASDIAGHCELVDYVRPHTARTNRVFQSGVDLRTVMKNAHSLLHYGALKRRFERFEAFKDDFMPRSGKSFAELGEIETALPGYDLYLTGSDQIWNPFIYDDGNFDTVFFSSFAPKGARKAAYAPSFGSAVLDARHKDELRALLTGFSHLSAREKRGADILKEVTGVENIPVVLDPTLLLTAKQWGGIAAPYAQPRPYILCYFVSEPGALRAEAAALKKRHGLRVLQLGARRKLPAADKLVLDAGPREFLSLVKNAAFVLTNSFHGTVFSLLFGRDFLCDAGRGEEAGHSRAGGLLRMLGLEERLQSVGSSGAGDKLDAERARSLGFLREALTGGTGNAG